MWSKYEDQLTLLQTTKLSTGMSQGFEAWKKAQSVLLTEYNNQVDKLTGELQTHIKESVKDIITNAIKVADVETMASMHKDEKGYKTSKKVIATEINKVLDDQSKLVKATVKQFMINDGKIVSQIKTDIKRQVKYSASHTRELKERQLEHLNNAATYDVVKRYSLDTEFRSTKVQYPSGRQMSLRSHVEMNIRTHVQQVALNTMSKACNNLGYDLFLASEHADCADDHIKYQGKVFTTHPSKYDGKYPSKKDAEKEGFCTRPNCRHFWIPITEEQANNLDATKKSLFIKKGEYDPKNYEDLKKQRYNERAIRHYKNKRDNLLALAQNATGAEKMILENDAEKYNAKVKEWQKRQRDLMKENDFLTRDYQRENAQKLAYDLGFRLENKDLVVDKVEKVKYTYGALDAYSSDKTIRDRAGEYGEERFEFYRNIKTKPAIDRIYNNLTKQNKDISRKEVERFYNHLFKEKHDLEKGYTYFDGDYDMAQSVDRIYYGKETIKKHDIVMIKHEVMESKLMEQGMIFQEAHDKTNETFNYTKELIKYKKSRKRE